MYFTNINFGQYVPTNSFIHKLDPRAKLFSLLIIVSFIFPAKNFVQVCLWGLILALVVHVSKISWPVLLKASRPVFFLIAFTFIFNIVSGYLRSEITQAFLTGLFTSLRLFVLMLFAVILPLTTTPLELSDGLDNLLRPLEKIKFPAHECAMMIGMALRFIPLLMHETDKIIRAQLSRGARLDQGNLFQRIKSFLPVLIPLFIIIFRRADEIAVAMEARGYNGGAGRTRRRPLIWKFKDTLAILISIFISVGIYIFN